MNARQRRNIRRGALRWMPNMHRAFEMAAYFVEQNNPVIAVQHLKECAKSIEDCYRMLAKRPMKQVK